MSTFRVIVAGALLVGCQASAGADPQPSSSDSAARFEHDMIVRFHMHENFDLLRAIEKLVIRGKLDEARTLARAMAEAPDEPGMAPWAPHAARVRERALALATASNTDEACRREAQLAVACSGCHVDAGVVPEFNAPRSAPPDRSTVEARMTRHLWATERLWEGIVGAADDSWRAGLDVLAATPLPSLQPEQEPRARRLQQLADQARSRQTTTTADERGRLYGEILMTCSGCHASANRTVDQR